ncbi:hypothetical protein MHPYR_130063 [uncultured Mycobacterium sp.]|uniref:Uncharacterized protein n=1 Tax=uncultured Mycobacterium sp. TaxID=171292 RepID=A0A1Y5P4M8_9MYCO|nr:hypothetical protein MHPYR_130063 [uncultured Mycobacterium sp.]
MRPARRVTGLETFVPHALRCSRPAYSPQRLPALWVGSGITRACAACPRHPASECRASRTR